MNCHEIPPVCLYPVSIKSHVDALFFMYEQSVLFQAAIFVTSIFDNLSNYVVNFLSDD